MRKTGPVTGRQITLNSDDQLVTSTTTKGVLPFVTTAFVMLLAILESNFSAKRTILFVIPICRQKHFLKCGQILRLEILGWGSLKIAAPTAIITG